MALASYFTADRMRNIPGGNAHDTGGGHHSMTSVAHRKSVAREKGLCIENIGQSPYLIPAGGPVRYVAARAYHNKPAIAPHHGECVAPWRSARRVAASSACSPRDELMPWRAVGRLTTFIHLAAPEACEALIMPPICLMRLSAASWRQWRTCRPRIQHLRRRPATAADA